jgi:hypothetical protein
MLSRLASSDSLVQCVLGARRNHFGSSIFMLCACGVGYLCLPRRLLVLACGGGCCLPRRLVGVGVECTT